MSDLLLTHGYFLGEDPKEQQIMKPYPPLGLLYLSAYLKRAGFGVEVFDSTFGTRDALEARLSAGPGVLGIYTNLITRGSVVRIARRAKELGWTVVVGGPESANYPEEYLSRGADVVVVGEGEETMAELLPALAAKGAHRLQGIRGTTFRDESGEIVHNLPRAQIADIDSLPWPDRDAIDIQRYVDVWRTHHGAGSVNLITARGCPYKCKWCSHAVFGYTHRRRSPIGCADELESIVERWNPDQVWYADDVFTIHHRWLVEYQTELKKRGLKIPFETISRADRLKGSRAQGMEGEDVIKTLAELGCWRLWIGSESGSQKILDAMQRDVTVEEVQWATRAVRRHGIQVGMFLMWGYEGETMEDVAATVEHVKRAEPDVFLTTVSYPIKGTPYFETVKDKVELAGAWETSTDRDYAIGGRPPKTYYELADRWLRSEVAACVEEDATLARSLATTAAESRAGMERILREMGPRGAQFLWPAAPTPERTDRLSPAAGASD
jgi:anaerobic magnesium-protoporphyrin IX monomethyl ester cyclase